MNDTAERTNTYHPHPHPHPQPLKESTARTADNPGGSGLCNLTTTCRFIPFQHRNTSQPFSKQTPQETRNWIVEVCKQIIQDMDRYGVCVIDNLLGEARGTAILKEVQMMYSTGAFTDGQLVKGANNTEGPSASQLIRGDKITWVDGREPNCRNIAVLMKLLDNLVIGANSIVNSGKLGGYSIRERSKAMVACYPGSGTHYVKHVDNPNDDGRCVTAIYYLNKDWNSKETGGLLRIFPEGWSHQVADIDPLFDRVIFFWSDRRNPHEVQPAFKTRYAITLWYFDSNAKEKAKSAETNS
ncbi:Egl nine 1 [Orchesella cincta]|uniref:hypoxia-inducible factor-proline dioxygenase n=1 Tax=Orchesella cincta TaxID=48709 RepID=A0A1D2MRM9_ORCCI|nr:Egl nine 1 [Orchesella cincta]